MGPGLSLRENRDDRYLGAMAVVDLLELPALLAPNAPIAGLDLGEKTIGVGGVRTPRARWRAS